MPTALSSTEATPRGDWRRPVRDVGHLLWFRSASVRRRAALLWASVVMAGITAAVAVVPAYVPADDERRLEVGVLLPTAMAGLLLIAVVSAIASGGGRELLTREHGVAFPVSPATDHLGALLLAPLNVAWLIQAWLLLGAAAYAVGPSELATLQPVVVLWLALATALGQLAAWSVEAVRRHRHGIVVIRAVITGLVVGAVIVQLAGRTVDLLDRIPTLWLVVGGLHDSTGRWLLTLAVELALLVAVVGLGVVPASLALRQLPHDELRMEGDTHPPRSMPWTDLTALLRLDRASVWRAVPMRRGLAVLAVGPGLVALIGDLAWPSMAILPGLVVSGGALLFGVNAWCLDARGALWRENLPARSELVFWVRVLVLAEFLGLASLATILLASLRAGVPSTGEVTALVCTIAVVTVQVVGASMRWSEQRPYPVDLRSARATPAPPVVMVGYSARLAVSTTLTGLVFSGLARIPEPGFSVFLAIIFLTWSSIRLARAGRRWADPATRARVVTAVAAV